MKAIDKYKNLAIALEEIGFYGKNFNLNCEKDVFEMAKKAISGSDYQPVFELNWDWEKMTVWIENIKFIFVYAIEKEKVTL